MRQDTKDRTISAVGTLLILLACILLCSWLGFKIPNPPIEEEGMGVAGEVLGEIEGFGNNDEATLDDNSAASPSSSTPEESYTTGEESTPVAKTTKTDNTPKPEPKKEPVKPSPDNKSNTQSETPQPTTNPMATFRGNKNGKGGEGKGTATGSGKAGNPDGTPGGQGGSGKGNGSGFNLGGRSLKGTLPVPNYNTDKDGDVVVRIKVDRDGNVVAVEAPVKGSTTSDRSMVEAAKQAARKAHFNANPNATEYQYGTITYKFRRQG